MAYKIYGLTYTEDDKPIIRTPRSTKVGIGVPKGPDLYAFIDKEGKFCISTGDPQFKQNKEDRGPTVFRFDTLEEAQVRYRQMGKTVVHRKFPAKLPHFIFTKLTATNFFEPDWDAMAKHGVMPTEIDVIFLHDDPFHAQFEMWASSGLQCHGDGRDALRLNALAKTPEEKTLAKESEARGEKVFPILNGCWSKGCPYANPETGLCKPHGKLSFQLIARPTLGGTAQYDTTGFRTVGNISSCLEEFKAFTGGRVAGIPLKLIVRPHTVTIKDRSGKAIASIAYNVSLEFRTEHAEQLKQSLIEQANKWAASEGTEYPKALPESRGLPAPELSPDDEDDYSEEQRAAMMEAEFYPVEEDSEESPAEDPNADLPEDAVDAEDGSVPEVDDLPPDNEDFGEPGAPDADRKAATATDEKVNDLVAQLKRAQAKKQAAEQTAKEAPPPEPDPMELQAEDAVEPEPVKAPEPPKVEPKPKATPKAAPAAKETKGALKSARDLFGYSDEPKTGGWD